MAAPAFPNQIPVAEIGDLIAAVRSGDYAAKETVRTALYVAGCVNELRGPTPFGAASDDALPQMSDTAVCDAIEVEIPEGYGAADDAEALPPVVTTLLIELAFRVLRRFLDR